MRVTTDMEKRRRCDLLFGLSFVRVYTCIAKVRRESPQHLSVTDICIPLSSPCGNQMIQVVRSTAGSGDVRRRSIDLYRARIIYDLKYWSAKFHFFLDYFWISYGSTFTYFFDMASWGGVLRALAKDRYASLSSRGLRTLCGVSLPYKARAHERIKMVMMSICCVAGVITRWSSTRIEVRCLAVHEGKDHMI